MRFHYTASQFDGKVVEGNIEAEGVARVLDFLVNKGLRPISVRKVGEAEIIKSYFRGSKINLTDKIFLTKYLALLLKVGTDLLRALDILIADFKKPAVKDFLIEVKSALEKGQPFYSVFAQYPKYFSPVFINLIKAGEASGNLEMIFEKLSASLENEQSLRHRIRSAVVYPILLFIMSAAILIFLVTFVLPRIASVFLSGGIEPPRFSKAVFAIGLFFGKYIWPILFIVAALVVGGLILMKTKVGKNMISRFINRVPIIKNVIYKIAIQRFAATLSSLLRAGLPIIDSLEITADAVGQPELSFSLKRISREGIARGLTLGEAFKKEVSFPLVISNLVAISEKAGHLDEILETLGKFYESEIDSSIKILVALIEPLMLLGIGAIVGIIALSIIMPIYQLVGQF